MQCSHGSLIVIACVILCAQVWCECAEFSDYDTEPMVQCETCGCWQHTECVGGAEQVHQHVCRRCVPMLESASTLVVCPPSIAHQWEQEVQKHAPGTKLLQYLGCRIAPTPRAALASAAIVVTTYDALRADFCHTEPHQKSLRGAKRYRTQLSPLTRYQTTLSIAYASMDRNNNISWSM